MRADARMEKDIVTCASSYVNVFMPADHRLNSTRRARANSLASALLPPMDRGRP
jgi:hypothetical protein